MRRFLLLLALAGVAFAVFQACSEKHDPYTDDNPTSGHILILADEDLRSIVEEEEMVFESIYEKAQIDVRYLSEAQLLKAMMNDSVRCTISTVLPGGEQEAYLKKRRVIARPVPICTDGIALMVSKASSVKQTDLPHFLASMAQRMGSHTEPHEVPFPALKLLFVGNGSGVARTLIDSLYQEPAVLQKVGSTVADLDELVQRVSQDTNAVGMVPFAAISDLDDPHVKQLRDQVRLVAVSKDEGPGVLPSQSTLADGSYPLRRTVHMILTEGKSGLGTGFVSFVANHKGQRIILKKGLAPQKVPSRDVEIVTP